MNPALSPCTPAHLRGTGVVTQSMAKIMQQHRSDLNKVDSKRVSREGGFQGTARHRGAWKQLHLSVACVEWTDCGVRAAMAEIWFLF
jgi:hypothetical protein